MYKTDDTSTDTQTDRHTQIYTYTHAHTYIHTHTNKHAHAHTHYGCNKPSEGSEPSKVYQHSESKLPFKSFITMVTFQLRIINETFLNHIGLLLCLAILLVVKLDKF